MKIHHIAIICSDYKISKQFYTKILGFDIISETYREERDSIKLDLKVGESDRIELFSFPNPPKRPSKPESCGLRHIAFQVNDVLETRINLMNKGLLCEEIRLDELTNKKFFFTVDPDDLPIEFYEK